MNYQQSLDFLFSQLPMFSRIGAAAYKPGLDTSIALDNYFGNPHRQYKTIHIAGTNGKGSTSHILAAMLQSAGYRVGLYTSPHLADFRERIRVNGEMIPRQDVVDFVERWQRCQYAGHPSFFELTMMMAFDWFARQKVDIAVIEVGMGGRLDSTNIITPIGCVITNISPDHTQFLGNTLPEIATEKAGIIKNGIPVVIGEAEGDVRQVFELKACEVDAPIIFAEDEHLLTSCHENDKTGGWDCRAADFSFHCELAGDYQRKNINTVLSAVKMLRNVGLILPDEAVAEGFSNVCGMTGLAGRWMITSQTPLTVCDTGHNIAGLSETMPQLLRLRDRKGGKVRMVIGFVSDKDVEHIKHLLPRDAVYYTTQASVPRAMDATELHRLLTDEGLNSLLCGPGVGHAYDRAVAESDQDDVIYVGGSTFIVADYLAEKQPQ
ncbi:MAG: bifunctional folylpolyglutamate synthase/dihydrofolate synthase [Muribaculaceae bacterium]|nr:bifunctional folylpolyglutamate synthase/dihydrofolate synthase [Muribaculaceae bacterium]